MRPVWDEYVELSQSDERRSPWSTRPTRPLAATGSGTCRTHCSMTSRRSPSCSSLPPISAASPSMDKDLERPPITGGGSIYPFCWSILLAARARGLGGVMTTFLSRAEPAAGPALGLPPDHALAATIFLGYPVDQPTRLRRRGVAAFATIDRFDGPAFTRETPS